MIVVTYNILIHLGHYVETSQNTFEDSKALYLKGESLKPRTFTAFESIITLQVFLKRVNFNPTFSENMNNFDKLGPCNHC